MRSLALDIEPVREFGGQLCAYCAPTAAHQLPGTCRREALDMTEPVDPTALGEQTGAELAASTPGLTSHQISRDYRAALSMVSFQAGITAGRAGLDDKQTYNEFMPAFLRTLYEGFE